MTLTTRNQNMIRQKAEALNLWIGGFLRDCKVRDLSTFTIEFCRAHDVTQVQQITADLIRSYLLHLEATGHNPGGRHAKYRAMHAFLRWYQNEAEPVTPKRTKPPHVYVWNRQYCGQEAPGAIFMQDLIG